MCRLQYAGRGNIMEFVDLKAFLERHKDKIEWARTEEDLGAIYLKSDIWDTIIRIDLDKLMNIGEAQIIQQLEAGKNVIQMTRVTGFYSIVKNWNKGKTGELKERYRGGGNEESERKYNK